MTKPTPPVTHRTAPPAPATPTPATPTPPATPATPGSGRLRLAVGWVAILSTLPYLVLKVAWSLGSTIGLTDPSVLDDPTAAALNWATGGLELVALVVAVAFAYPWGMRIPAWLVSFPLWFGMGLLVPRIVSIPIAAVFTAGSHAPATGRTPQDLVEPWVFVVVPAAFAVQGIALATAFVLYARARWGGLLRTRIGRGRHGATGRFQSVAAVASTIMMGAVLVLLLVGVVTIDPEDRGAAVAGFVTTALWLATATGGLLVLTTGRFGHRLPLWAPVGLTWLGTGSMFAWGMWVLVVALAPSAAASNTAPPLFNICRLMIVCAGLAMALVGTFAVTERSAEHTATREHAAGSSAALG